MRVSWSTPVGELVMFEPTAEELATYVPALVTAYNDPHNAAMLGHTALLDEADVFDHYAHLRATGGWGLLLLRDGVLAGDGDLRGVKDYAAELAFLISAPSAQGKGLGTRFALMMHYLAIGKLRLRQLYAAVIPSNVASLRVFEKLGYTRDDHPDYGDEGDVVLSVARGTIIRMHGATFAEMRE